MKLPAFQFYPGDWRKDPGVQSLNYECRGVWLEILCLMHESENRGILTLNGRAMSDEALSRLLGIDQILLKQILTKLEEHGVASRQPNTNALMSRRMVRDETTRKIRAECGKQGGNPRLLKQNPTKDLTLTLTTGDNQIPTPSVSSSVSSSDIYEAYPKKIGRHAAIKAIDRALGLKNGNAVTAEALLDRTKAYAAAVSAWPEKDQPFIPHPATWFNRGSYDDDPQTWQRDAGKPKQHEPQLTYV